MFRSFTMTGQSGEIRRGPTLVAASLGAWSLTPGSAPDTWSFTASLRAVDDFHITQPPFRVELHRGKNPPLRWREATVEIGDGKVRGILTGAPED